MGAYDTDFEKVSVRTVQVVCLFLFLSLMIPQTGLTEQGKEEKNQKVKFTSSMKEIEGEVSAINKQGIAIVYKKDAEKNQDFEIYLPINKNLRLVHKQSLDQIKVGDIVNVQYEETIEEHKEGSKAIHGARVITFVRAAPPPKPSSSALVSGVAREEEEEGQ